MHVMHTLYHISTMDNSFVQTILTDILQTRPFPVFIAVKEFIEKETSSNSYAIRDFETVCEDLDVYFRVVLHIHPYNLMSILNELYPNSIIVDSYIANIIHIQANMNTILGIDIYPRLDYYGILQMISPHYYENRFQKEQEYNDQLVFEDSDTEYDAESVSISEYDTESIS